jgi:hypothetical protein
MYSRVFSSVGLIAIGMAIMVAWAAWPDRQKPFPKYQYRVALRNGVHA